MAVSSFRFRNLFSIRDAELKLDTPVTLLIGPNGAGKSNILRGIELISLLTGSSFPDAVMREGGFGEYLFQGRSLAGFEPSEQGYGFDPECFAVNMTQDINEQLRNGYDVQFLRGVGDTPLLRERLWFWDTAKCDKPFYTEYRGNNGWLSVAKQSILANAPAGAPGDNGVTAAGTADTGSRSGVPQNVLEVLAGCRVFHFDDTSPRSPVLRSCDVADSYQLHADGRNLAAVLWRMQQTDLERYQGIMRSVRSVAPFIEDFVVAPYEGSRSTRLRWSQRGVDGVFSGERLSSGTLRFICLAVLLQQTTVPQTIVLDEPELGLHPFAIYQLGEMLHEHCGGERRIVVTTQSVTLANQFTLEEIALVTRENGETTITRPQPSDYQAWLDDYSVGQLWESNILNLAPRNEAGI